MRSLDGRSTSVICPFALRTLQLPTTKAGSAIVGNSSRTRRKAPGS